MDTLEHAISIIERDGQQPCILAEGNRHTEHEQRHGNAQRKEDLNVNSFHHTVSMMMKRTTEQITDVSRGNTAGVVGIGPVPLKLGAL